MIYCQPISYCFFFISLIFFTAPPTSLLGLQVNNLSCLEKLNPGEKKQIQIILINDSDSKEQVNLKLANYACNSDGEHFYDEDYLNDLIKYPRSNKSWIDHGLSQIYLEPRETRNIYYTIHVPNDDTLVGSYWSILLIEPQGTTLSKDTVNEGFSLQIKIRYAHHIIASIGDATPKLKILKKEIKEINGKPFLCLHVLNEGNLFFEPNLTLKLYDDNGKLEATLKSQSERLYPGNSQCFLLNVETLSEEKLKGKLIGFLLFDGNENLFFGDKFTYP